MHCIVDETKMRLFVGYDTLELVELHNSNIVSLKLYCAVM